MYNVIMAVVLEALRQKMSPSRSPDEFLGKTPLSDMQEAGLQLEAWKPCQSHDRFLLYVEPAERIVAGCYDCLHRHVQHVYSPSETVRFIDHLRHQGVTIPKHKAQAISFFLDDAA